ncbi:MAG: hypothetical protein AAGI10_11520 [Pseudomonadota bacterium]
MAGGAQTSRAADQDFLTGAVCPAELSEGGCFQEWLQSFGFSEIRLPDWEDADYWAWRDLVLTVLALAPNIRIAIESTAFSEGRSILDRIKSQWPAEIIIGRDTGVSGSGSGLNQDQKSAGSLDGPYGGKDSRCALLEVVEKADRDFRKPEPTERIEAKLALLRERVSAASVAPKDQLNEITGNHIDTGVLRQSAIAANSVIPGSRAADAGLHIGAGYVLRPWTDSLSNARGVSCGRAGYHLMPIATDIIPRGKHGRSGHVVLDPREGKVLKHERVHALFVGETKQVRFATAALTVLGTTDRHILLSTQNTAARGKGTFYFNESWQFIGMGVDQVEPDELPSLSNPVVAVIRTRAIWDDLVAMADRGSVSAADALRTLDLARAWQRRAMASRGYLDRKALDTEALVRGGYGG